MSGKGDASASAKLQRAQAAIHIGWLVFGRLLLWAQSQIVGYEVARESPTWIDALAELRGGTIDEDMHELVGLPDQLEALEGGLCNAALRRVIVRLLLSTDANSSFWRFPLSHALGAANAGERDELFEPARTRRRGRPYQLDWARAIAVAHVHFLVGKGFKKHRALEQIADALAVSVETLRDWEKALAKDDWFSFEWRASQLAGRLEEEIRAKSYWELHAEHRAEFFGPESALDAARYFLDRRKDTWSLESLKADLRRLHSGEE